MSTRSLAELICPAPLTSKDTILLGHGSGGKLSAELLRDVFLPSLSNPVLARLDDQAIVNINGQRIAFTTDSFVVKPLFFPGGDIGSLAVHGTINDLAMGGATPLFLSAAFIIEEGFAMNDLRRIVVSMHQAAADAGVQVVTGDTKVVETGKGDGIFINTTGIGTVPMALNSQQIVLSLEIRYSSVARLVNTGSRFWRSAKVWNSKQQFTATALRSTRLSATCLQPLTRSAACATQHGAACRAHSTKLHNNHKLASNWRSGQFQCARRFEVPARCWDWILSTSPTKGS